MNIVITMAGLGLRFREAGYTVPKYRIEAHGKSLFEWSMISLTGYYDQENRYFFIVRKEDDSAAFINSMCEKLGIVNKKVIEIETLTDGQATTALLASKCWDPVQPLLVYNIDTFVRPGAMHKKELKGDGFIPCFHASGDHWSFVKTGDSGRAVEVREKQRISDNCTLGAYYFKTAALFEKIYESFFIRTAGIEKGEKYIAPMYNYLIQNGGEVYISLVPEEDIFVLGTPGELQFFIDHYIP